MSEPSRSDEAARDGDITEFRRLHRAWLSRRLVRWDMAGVLAMTAWMAVEGVRMTSGSARGWTWPTPLSALAPAHRMAAAIAVSLAGFVFLWLTAARTRPEDRAGRTGVVCPACGFPLLEKRPANPEAVVRCQECGVRFRIRDYVRLYPHRRWLGEHPE